VAEAFLAEVRGRCGEPEWDEVGEVILDAYRQVAPKTLVSRLDTA
jgi:hypothetical protein